MNLRFFSFFLLGSITVSLLAWSYPAHCQELPEDDPMPKEFHSSFVDPEPETWSLAFNTQIAGMAGEIWFSYKIYRAIRLEKTLKAGLSTDELLKNRIKGIPELESLRAAQDQFMESLAMPTSQAQWQSRLEELEALQRDLVKDQTRKKKVYGKAEKLELDNEIAKLRSQTIKSPLDQQRLVESLRDKLKIQQEIALTRLTDERRFLSNELSADFQMKINERVSPEGVDSSENLKKIKTRRSEIFEDLQTAKPRFKPADLKQIDDELKIFLKTRNVDPGILGLARETSGNLALESINFIKKNPPTLSEKLLSRGRNLGKKSLKLVRFVGGLALFADAGGRAISLWVLDIDPTFSPVLTASYDASRKLFWKQVTIDEIEKTGEELGPLPDSDVVDPSVPGQIREPKSLKEPTKKKPSKVSTPKVKK